MAIFLGLSVAFGSSAYADEPLLPPASFEASSPNSQCRAFADVAASRIVGLSLGDQARKELWTIPEYEQFIRLGDDCQSLMALYRGAELLAEEDYDPSTVVLSFFYSGKLIKRVSLGELYSDIDVLPRTVSHYLWLKAADWDGGKWSIRTVDNRTILFDPASGERVK